MQLLDDVCFINSVRSSQVTRILRASLESQHMVKLVLSWPPKGPIDGKLQFFSPALPVIIDKRGKLLEGWLIQELLLLFLNKADNPALTARKHIVSACSGLQLSNCPLQKLFTNCQPV
jgi:hypothetical protein